MHLLLVEDDDRVAAALTSVLERHGYEITRAESAARARANLGDGVDVVLLDLMLPDGDGLALCADIRSASGVPILITSARADLSWRLHGLNLGADDYLVKPYDIRELMARIVAVTRRTKGPRPAQAIGQCAEVLSRQGVGIDLRRREVRVDGVSIPLTRKEFGVLAELASSPGVVVRRERLLSAVWHSMYEADGHTLDVHVAAVRAKTRAPRLIETVRGVGYRLAAD